MPNSKQVRAAELERCKAHADANHDGRLDDTSEPDDESPAIIKSNTKCPHPTCEQRKPFAKGQQLRVHFRTRKCHA